MSEAEMITRVKQAEEVFIMYDIYELVPRTIKTVTVTTESIV